jgi:hypothetical protein
MKRKLTSLSRRYAAALLEHLRRGPQASLQGALSLGCRAKQISRELQNRIAQTLLGIHVRLLGLKQGARVNAQGLKNEIAGTQRLVVESARSMRRIAGTIACESAKA